LHFSIYISQNNLLLVQTNGKQPIYIPHISLTPEIQSEISVRKIKIK